MQFIPRGWLIDVQSIETPYEKLSDVTCQDNFGFSLYAVLSVCYIVTILDTLLKSERKVSTDSGVLLLKSGIEFNRDYC